MVLDIAVCEDEEIICRYLAETIEKCFQQKNHMVHVDRYLSPKDLLKVLNQKLYHGYFLDIDMEGMNGIQLAGKIRSIHGNQEAGIIFVSNKEEMVYQTFKESPLRFIRKKYFDREIGDAVTALTALFQKDLNSFVIEQGGKILSVQVSGIRYVESLDRVQIIHTQTKDYSIHSKLSQIQENLEGRGFLRIHKSYLVNWRFIYSIGVKEVVLENGEKLPLSKHRVKEIKQRYRRLAQEALF